MGASHDLRRQHLRRHPRRRDDPRRIPGTRATHGVHDAPATGPPRPPARRPHAVSKIPTHRPRSTATYSLFPTRSIPHARRMRSLLLFIGFGVGLALAACSSSETDDDDDGADGSDGTAAAGTGASGVGGAGGAPSDGVPVPCGPDLTCVGGEACCFAVAAGEIPPLCAATCPADPPHTALTCLGSADCDGMACCGSALFGYECSTSTSCPASEIQLCFEDADCPSNECNFQTVQTVEVGSCTE